MDWRLICRETTWEKKGIYWKLYGVVTGREIEKLTVDIFSDPRFDDLKYAILDFLSIDDIVMSHEELESIAAQDMAAAITNPSIKIALVGSDPRVKALAAAFNDMFGGHPWEASYHENLAEARRWGLEWKTSLFRSVNLASS